MSKYQQAVDDWVSRGESDDYPVKFEKEPLRCRSCGKFVHWKSTNGKWVYADFDNTQHVCLTSTVKFWKLPKKLKQGFLK